MQSSTFRFANVDGDSVVVRCWLPDVGSTRASVLIAHGAAEHSGRYERLAGALTAIGIAVYAPDHRGHGQTAGELSKAGNAGVDGFNGIIRDLRQLSEIIRQRHLELPLFLVGHSMGAALSQRFMQLHGAVLRGVVLSGSPGLRPNLEQTATFTEQLAKGDEADKVSTVFSKSFASFNEGFADASTGYEWLSRDASEVQKYVQDPWCGFPFTNRLVAEMSQCALEAAQPVNLGRIPHALSILLLAGTQDRVGGNGEFVSNLAAAYRQAGITDLQVLLYAEGRHEMLNEVNRDTVTRDLIDWLTKRM